MPPLRPVSPNAIPVPTTAPAAKPAAPAPAPAPAAQPNPTSWAAPVASARKASDGFVSAPSAIPNVQEIVRAGAADPLKRNEAFNAAHQQFGKMVQQVVDPQGLGPEAGVIPNWFGLGAYASAQVGRSMVIADRIDNGINLMKGEPHLSKRGEILDAMKLQGGMREVATKVSKALELVGFSEGEATALGATTTVMLAAERGAVGEALLKDPRVGIAVAYRLAELLTGEKPSPKGVLSGLGSALKGLFGGNDGAKDSKMLGRIQNIARTFKNMLAEGNVNVFGDVGGSAETFLKLKQAEGGKLTTDAVLQKLNLPESSAAGATKAYQWALANLNDPNARDFSKLAGPGSGNDRTRAAFALFVKAGETSDVAEKNKIVRMANALLLWREQAEQVQPAFVGTKPGEVSRPQIIDAITPMLKCDLSNGLSWHFEDWAKGQKDRDGNILTAKPSEYRWATFEDRWPATLDTLESGYRNAKAVWDFPSPKVTETT